MCVWSGRGKLTCMAVHLVGMCSIGFLLYPAARSRRAGPDRRRYFMRACVHTRSLL